MSMHKFVSITTTVAYICHKLTIMFLFCPFHSDDAFCALLPEVKAVVSCSFGELDLLPFLPFSFKAPSSLPEPAKKLRYAGRI